MRTMKDFSTIAFAITEYGFSYIVGDDNLDDFVKYCDETRLLVDIIECGTILSNDLWAEDKIKLEHRKLYFVKER